MYELTYRLYCRHCTCFHLWEEDDKSISVKVFMIHLENAPNSNSSRSSSNHCSNNGLAQVARRGGIIRARVMGG